LIVVYMGRLRPANHTVWVLETLNVKSSKKTQRGLSGQPPLVLCVSVQAENRDGIQTADIIACSNVHACKVTIYRRR
jgi:hypothetical protein